MRQFFISVYIFCVSAAVSQTNSELLQLGDDAFTRGNYVSAAWFYKKILISHHGGAVQEVAYPHEIKNYTPPPKKKKSKKQKGDSLNTEPQEVNRDSVFNISEIKIAADTGEMVIHISGKATAMLYVLDQLAASCRLGYQYENAEKWYNALHSNGAGMFNNATYWYGNSLLKNGKYKQAMSVLTDFVVEIDRGNEYFKKAEQDIKRCAFAQTAMRNGDKTMNIQIADSLINKGISNFSAAFINDESEVLFASSRKGTLKSEKQKEIGYNFCDFYSVPVMESGTAHPKNLGTPINSFDHEGAAALSPDGTKLFFTRWNNDECAIYVSKYLNGIWLQPKKLDEKVNIPNTKSMHPAISPFGDVLYFVSDRPGGVGSTDIWYCTIDGFDNTGPVINLGYNVNTKGDEMTPFFRYATNTFYFSSNGHIGMGGLDVFMTYPDNNFGAPIDNLGTPVNSSRDDAYFIMNSEGKKGFFSSDRDGCDTTCAVGSCYSIYEIKAKSIVITISGKVFNAKTNEPISNSLVQFIDVSERMEPIFAFTDETGGYSTTLRRGFEYFVSAQKNKFFKDATSVSTMNINESTNFVHDFYLQPIEDIILPIEYDFDKATLRPESKEILNDLVDFLELNDHIIIEISSHTDERGNEEYNLNLSQARAKSVVDYFIKKGIPKERMEWKGHGEQQLLVLSAQTEDEHQRNRRTVFRTLSEDYQPTQNYRVIPKKYRNKSQENEY